MFHYIYIYFRWLNGPSRSWVYQSTQVEALGPTAAVTRGNSPPPLPWSAVPLWCCWWALNHPAFQGRTYKTLLWTYINMAVVVYFLSLRMSPPQAWTPSPDASFGTPSWVSFRTGEQWSSPHTGKPRVAVDCALHMHKLTDVASQCNCYFFQHGRMWSALYPLSHYG